MVFENEIRYNFDTNILDIHSGKDVIEIQICSNSIAWINFQPDGNSSPDTPVIDPLKEWNSGNLTELKTDTNQITITTSEMKIEINRSSGRLSIYDAEGCLLLKEQDMPGMDSRGVSFIHNEKDNFYGIFGSGAYEEDKGILRNSGGVIKAGNQGHSGSPLVWSTSGYGLLFDTDGGEIKIDNEKLEFIGNSKKDLEFYIILGNPKDIFMGVGEISGKPPMMPKWSLGFTNSEWGINQEELQYFVDTYREKQIPIDNYTLDFDWKDWGADNYGEFRWNPENFPDGPGGNLKSDMDKKGIKITGILKPRVHYDTEQGRYAEEHGFWWPGGEPFIDYCSGKVVQEINFSIKECREWFFDHIKEAFNTGISGWWNDEQDRFDENMQGMNMQKAIYYGQRSFTNRRVWSINRNFYLGSQRYAYGLWSGDIDTGFEVMAAHREKLISAVNTGVVKWGMDGGGFCGMPSSENYARWIQFSAFTPIFRVHGTENAQRQPWIYGPIAEAAAKSAIQLRYKLIPYIYSYERKACETGIGLIRPLIFDFPQDVKAADYSEAWMFGEYLLISPIVEKRQKLKSIYLPKGEWINYFTGEVHIGGKVIKYITDSKRWTDIPLFIKKGAIIPSQDIMNYVGEKQIITVYVDVFTDKFPTSFTYYDDDGITYEYENGGYFSQVMTTQYMGDKISFIISNAEGSFKPGLQHYLIKFHGCKSKSITVNNNDIPEYSCETDLTASEYEGWTKGTDVYGEYICLNINAGTEKDIIINPE